jgi:hypothetical protein
LRFIVPVCFVKDRSHFVGFPVLSVENAVFWAWGIAHTGDETEDILEQQRRKIMRDSKLFLDGLAKGIAKDQSRGVKLRRYLIANKEHNWLLAIMLNSCAKVSANASMTDLEKIVIDAFRNNGFSDEDIKEQGRLYQEISQETRREIFPEKFLRLNTQTQYDLKQLQADLPKIQEIAVSNLSSVESIDLQNIQTETELVPNFSVSPATPPTAGPTTNPSQVKYTIKAFGFRCIRRQKDSIFYPSNEPYFLFGTTINGKAVTQRSRIFQKIDGGDAIVFAADEGCIWGENCLPQAFPKEGKLGLAITAMEHDLGNVDKVKNGFAAAFASAAGILAATGVAAWIAAVVAAVGGAIQWFLSIAQDDLIDTQIFSFTREVIDGALGPIPNKKGVKQSFDVTRLFASPDGGTYRGRIRITRYT